MIKKVKLKILSCSNLILNFIIIIMAGSLLYFVNDIKDYMTNVDNKIDDVFITRSYYKEKIATEDSKNNRETVVKYINKNENCSTESNCHHKLLINIFKIKDFSEKGLIFNGLIDEIKTQIKSSDIKSEYLSNILKDERFIKLSKIAVKSRSEISTLLKEQDEAKKYIVENYFFKVAKNKSRENIRKIRDVIENDLNIDILDKDNEEYKEIISIIDDRLYVDNVVKRIISFMNNNY